DRGMHPVGQEEVGKPGEAEHLSAAGLHERDLRALDGVGEPRRRNAFTAQPDPRVAQVVLYARDENGKPHEHLGRASSLGGAPDEVAADGGRSRARTRAPARELGRDLDLRKIVSLEMKLELAGKLGGTGRGLMDPARELEL